MAKRSYRSLFGALLPAAFAGCLASRAPTSVTLPDPPPFVAAKTAALNDAPQAPDLPRSPENVDGVRPLPINLPTALQLAGAGPLDIALATQRVQAAAAELEQANTLWLPTMVVGADYFRHDGQLQDVAGTVFTTSRSAIMLGGSPNMVFAVTDAVYAPLAARQTLRARESDVQTIRNDTTLAVAESYFNVQQARGEIAASTETVKRTEDLLRRVESLTESLTPAVEKNRVLTDLSRRRQAIESAHERWQVASAELHRLLRLDSAALATPLEAPHLRVNVIDLQQSVDELVSIAWSSRPELASHKATIDATATRIRQERARPLTPNLLIRGAATNPAGSLAAGYFGGGINSDLQNFSARNTFDVQLLWELKNLGLGNQALVRQREAENQQACLALTRTQERIAAEVVAAHAQAKRSANRLRHAEEGVRNASVTVAKSIDGLKQTRMVGGTITLVFRPQEVVAAIQSLELAYRDYYAAVADSNRAQFRLYHALGQPAQHLRDSMQIAATGPSSPARASSLPPEVVAPAEVAPLVAEKSAVKRAR